jgi:hypothetical protein
VGGRGYVLFADGYLAVSGKQLELASGSDAEIHREAATEKLNTITQDSFFTELLAMVKRAGTGAEVGGMEQGGGGLVRAGVGWCGLVAGGSSRFLSVCRLSACLLSVSLSVCLSVCLSVLSVLSVFCLSCLSCLSVCLPVCLYACSYFCLCVCMQDVFV